MIGAVYVEREVADHPRARAILDRFPAAPRIAIERYGEVFNRRGQSFRLQKRRPGLILARKHGELVLPAPDGYGIGTERNFYFSHMLNCPYDCRYCFLQGMFRSAHYVVFVNFEDFVDEIGAVTAAGGAEDTTFFSGYDCDSLAFEGVTGFVADVVPRFAGLEGAVLELRTKSAHVGPLLDLEPIDNVVVAMSFTPQELSTSVEHGVPAVARRLRALQRLADAGWRLGLRFDPLLWVDDYRARYRELFATVFEAIDPLDVHSVSLGPFRLPAPFLRAIERQHPDEPLFAGPLEERGGSVSYRPDLEAELVGFCREELAEWVHEDSVFACAVPDRGAAAPEGPADA